MKKVLIAGKNSYIGEAVKDYLGQWKEKYTVKEIDTKGLKPKIGDFQNVDVVFCVAGIAHIKETLQNRHLYFDINQNLVVDIAKTAKLAGVHQFIILSSMSVYGLETGFIEKKSIPHPNTAYGESKLNADNEIKKMTDDNFLFTCLRPPMVYGKNCPGNYQKLRKVALRSPVFPNYPNQRSMIYIGNLCEFVKECIDNEKNGLFFPQNVEYMNTSNMVRLIADAHGKKIVFTSMFNWVIKLIQLNIIKKVFGSLIYEPVDTVRKYGFEESIKLTEE